MAKAKQIKDPNDLEVHPTVATFEVALRNAEPDPAGKKYYEIVLRSRDRTQQHQLLLTDNKRLATRRVMDYHAGVCGLQHSTGVQLQREW